MEIILIRHGKPAVQYDAIIGASAYVKWIRQYHFSKVAEYSRPKAIDRQICSYYLVSSDLTLTYNSIINIYQKRWKIEEYHKSLKQQVSLCKSPTKKARTQLNHIFVSLYGFFKLELLSIKSKLNPTAFRTRLYVYANRAAFNQLQNLKICLDVKF